jgi:hypothetical protein
MNINNPQKIIRKKNIDIYNKNQLIVCPMIQKRLTDDNLLKADYVKFKGYIDGGKQFVPLIKAIVDDLSNALIQIHQVIHINMEIS